MTEPICKGSFVLGSACAGCSRCREEWKKLRAAGWRFISPNIRILDVTTEMELDRLRSSNEKLCAALKPFAAIEPSSFYPTDGSEAEPYAVVLQEGGIHELSARVEFTGADLSRARSALTSPEATGETDNG